MNAPHRHSMSLHDGRQLLQRLSGLLVASAVISDQHCLEVEFGSLWSGQGQASLHIESRWRASRRQRVLTGSSANPRTAARHLGRLLDLPIAHIGIAEGIHDVTIALGDDHHLDSFHDGPGHPLWGLAINDANLLRGAIGMDDNARPWIGMRGGRVEVEYTRDEDDLLILEG